MAVQVMKHAQAALSSRPAPRFVPFECSSAAGAGAGARGRVSVPSSRVLGGGHFVTKLATETPSSSSKRKRMVVVSILEEPRVVHVQTTSLDRTEKLLEKFAGMGTPNDTDLSRMHEAADRLFLWDDIPRLAKKQTFSVFEMNEYDRDSPAYLELSRQTVNKIDPDTGEHIKAVGDLVPFTNKLYNSNLKVRLGITAGIGLHIKNYPGRGAPEWHSQPFFTPDRYEIMMSWHFGDMGHISAMGPYINFQDTLMGITGGSGFFAEARGVVRLHPITLFKFVYTFTLSGIPELPKVLTEELVTPHFDVESHPDAFDCKPDHVLPNYTN